MMICLYTAEMDFIIKNFTFIIIIIDFIMIKSMSAVYSCDSIHTLFDHQKQFFRFTKKIWNNWLQGVEFQSISKASIVTGRI